MSVNAQKTLFSYYFQISNFEGAGAHEIEIYFASVLKDIAGKDCFGGLDITFPDLGKM